jgi:3-hydroxyacyl-CoA dehydrogenase
MDYLHQQTGDSNFAPRPVLQELVESGRIGAVSGKGLYEFSQECDSVVKRRDKQLTDLLAWLQVKDPVANIGLDKKGR